MDYTTHKPRIGKLTTARSMLTPTRNARLKGDTASGIRERILTRDSGICRCADCLRTAALKPAHQVDHVVPLWAGGAEDDSNRASINHGCHQRKTAAEARMRSALAFNPEQWSTPCLIYIQRLTSD